MLGNVQPGRGGASGTSSYEPKGKSTEVEASIDAKAAFLNLTGVGQCTF